MQRMQHDGIGSLAGGCNSGGVYVVKTPSKKIILSEFSNSSWPTCCRYSSILILRRLQTRKTY